MKQHSLCPGARLLIDGSHCTLIKRRPDSVWLIEGERLEPRHETEVFLLQLYQAGRLEFFAEDLVRPDGRKTRRALPIGALSENEQIRVSFKMNFVQQMKLREFPGWHSPTLNGGKSSPFDEALKDVSALLGRVRPVSRGSYYDWSATLELHEDASELRSHYGKGHLQMDARAQKIIRQTIQAYVERAEDSRHLPEKPPTCSEIFRECRSGIDRENAEISRRNDLAAAHGSTHREVPIPKPSATSTYYDYWNEVDARKRMLVLKGARAVREGYRGGTGLTKQTRCLDLVEYDETRLPWFVYDEYLGISLGRPWFSWYIDVTSELPIGIYLGFEQVSDISLMSALRSACLPKAFLQSEYKGIGEYNVFGIPMEMVFDNPYSQHGRTILKTCEEFYSGYRFAPSEISWFKPHVESSFHAFNHLLLSQLPGVILKGVHRKDYDPTEHGCLGLRASLQLIWKWIADVFARGRHSKRNIPRIDVWCEDFADRSPPLLTTSRDLNELFWVIRDAEIERILDHRGIRYEGLKYFCPDLQVFREIHGSRRRVLVKVNPSDLEFILVRSKKGLPWCRAYAVDREYARGRSLRQHLLCRKHARDHYNADDILAYQLGEAELSEMIREAVTAASAMSVNSLAAKAWGLGSQHVTDALDHDGNLGTMGGPFRGHTLEPPMTVLNTFNRPQELAQRAAPPEGGTPIPIPDFSSDLSLGPRGT